MMPLLQSTPLQQSSQLQKRSRPVSQLHRRRSLYIRREYLERRLSRSLKGTMLHMKSHNCNISLFKRKRRSEASISSTVDLKPKLHLMKRRTSSFRSNSSSVAMRTRSSRQLWPSTLSLRSSRVSTDSRVDKSSSSSRNCGRPARPETMQKTASLRPRADRVHPQTPTPLRKFLSSRISESRTSKSAI